MKIQCLLRKWFEKIKGEADSPYMYMVTCVNQHR